MTVIYDNWERIVAAVIKKQQLWELFHQQSPSPSVSSESSSFSFNLNSSLDDVPFSFASPVIGDPIHKVGDDGVPENPLSILGENLAPVLTTSSNKNYTSGSTPPTRKKRNLKVEVPPNPLQHGEALSFGPDYCRYLSPERTSLSSPVISRVQNVASTPRHWPDDAKRQSYPLPLPPLGANSISSPVSRRSSASASPSTPLRSPERAHITSSPRARWKKGKLIGVGTFGKIYVGFCRETGELCAMKEVELFNTDAELSAKMIGKEIVLLSSLRHPNILRYYGSETIGNSFYMYTEYVSGGSISNILAEYGKLGESVIRNYTQQLLSVLSYIHSKNITHGDIKGANVLVDPNGLVKLGNFGVEKNIARKSSPLLHMENPYWMAPEAIMNPNRRSSAMDVWSLGCTIIEMATSESPWSQYKEGLALFKIANKELPSIPHHFSDECKDFLRQCLRSNPLHRATVSQLLEHPFVKVSSPLEKRITLSDHQTTSVEMGPRRLTNHSSVTPKSSIQDSDIYTPRNKSSPSSPVLSPLPLPCSPQHLNGKVSPPPTISSPHTKMSSSYLQLNNQDSHHKKSLNNIAYWDPKILQGASQLRSKESMHNDDEHLHRVKGDAFHEQVHDQSILANRLSQKPFQDHPVKFKSSLDSSRASQLLSGHDIARRVL